MTISLPPRTKVVGGEGRVSEDMGGGVVVAGGAGCAAGDYPVGPTTMPCRPLFQAIVSARV